MLKVLVVEDDPNALDVIHQAILLQNAQAEVLATSTAEDALELCRAQKPDLVIMDLSLPGINGWEALSALRTDPGTSNIPVVALTGYHSASVEDDAIKAGFDAYFSKPIDVITFGTRIAELAK